MTPAMINVLTFPCAMSFSSVFLRWAPINDKIMLSVTLKTLGDFWGGCSVGVVMIDL